MTQHAKLLCIHIGEIELLEEEFNKVASVLPRLSHKEGSAHRFKFLYRLMRIGIGVSIQCCMALA
jgi:hypothetical protein